MKRCFTIVVLALLAGLFTLPAARASEDGYTAVGSGFYVDGAGDYYTRERAYWSYYYDYYGRYIPRFYYWKYTPASKPVSSLTSRSTDADWIDFLAQREKIAGGIRANQEREDAFLARLKAIGVTPPFPAIPGYNGYGASYSKLGVVQGNTIYGYGQNYSYNQVAELYGPVDVNAAIQAMAMAGKWSQEATKEAGTQLTAVTAQALASTERIAIAREERIRAVESLRVTQPPSRITTTINGVGTAPVEPGPMVKVVDDGGTTRLIKGAATNGCTKCHGGAKPSGGLDMTKPMTAAQILKSMNRASLPESDPKHMPQKEGGGSAGQLDAAALKELLP